MKRAVLALGAVAALLAACDQPREDETQVLAEANASGAEVSNIVENAVAASEASPLQKQQALALIDERHQNYKRIGDAMKVVSQELRAPSPDLGRIRANADTIADLAPQVRDWFPAGTGPEAGETDARAAIWERPDDFAARARSFDLAAQRFNEVAQGADLEAIRAAHANLGGTCKACHDLYREKK